MITATVIGSGARSHPESGRACMTYDVDRPYADIAGSSPMTRLWAEEGAPEAKTGEAISWDRHRVELRGQAWRKVEYDSDAFADTD